MSKPVIVNASLSSIDANPWRDLASYPFNKKKIKALRRSIDETWFWAGVLARKVGHRYEIAFGHHRVEAAEQEGLSKIPLVVRDLDDDEMLKLMGLENLEDYDSDFLVQLNTWDAGVRRWRDLHEDQSLEGPGIARLVCWTRERTSGTGTASLMNATAAACHSARRAIDAKYLKKTEFSDMTVREARELAEPLMARVEAVERQRNKQGDKAIDEALGQLKGAASVTAQRVRAGNVKTKDIRRTLDKQTHHEGARSRKATPLFSAYARTTVKRIDDFLMEDTAIGDRLAGMVKVRNQITMEEDFDALALIDMALADLIDRAKEWREELKPTTQAKVIDFKKARRALAAGE